jgi:ketohexokinase
MARILVVGNATLDIVNTVERYPAEDAEVRAMGQSRRRGGNAANSAAVLARLGHRVGFAGTVADEPDGRFIVDDLRAAGVDTGPVQLLPGGKTPTSYVTLSRANGSRTIVHVRDLPEYTAEAFAAIDLSAYDWLHFEGRNVDALGAMLEQLRRQRRPPRCSLEAEKPRAGLPALFPRVDLLLFARGYAQALGAADAEAFLTGPELQALAADRVCAWGEAGAWGVAAGGAPHHAAAHRPPRVVDTLGAGDVFNAGVIDGLVQGWPLAGALERAARLAGRKCGVEGLAGF